MLSGENWISHLRSELAQDNLSRSHYLVGPTMAASDFCGLMLIGAASGYAPDVLERGVAVGGPNYLGFGCVVGGLTVLLLKSQGLYHRSSLLARDTIPVLKLWLMVIPLLVIAASITDIRTSFSENALIVYFVAGGAYLAGVRWAGRDIVRRVVDSGRLKPRRVLLIADNESSIEQLGTTLGRHGYAVGEAYALSPSGADEAFEWRQVIAAARSGEIDEIMLAMHSHEVLRIEQIVRRLEVLPVPIRLLPDHAMSRLIERPTTDIGLTTAIDLKREPLRVWERTSKQVFDVAVAAGALMLFAPLLLVVAALIKLDSPGPVLFRQSRVGFNGRSFRIYKFRTMKTLDDGEEIRQATRDDDRVTRVGRWLRATSVDELPQLINVLKGEMSLVGPRPHAVAHDKLYDEVIANYALRHHVKPGITGWAQVCGFRGETPTVELMLRRIEHDLWYIHHWSFWLDTVIIVRTAVSLMRPQNAY